VKKETEGLARDVCDTLVYALFLRREKSFKVEVRTGACAGQSETQDLRNVKKRMRPLPAGLKPEKTA